MMIFETHLDIDECRRRLTDNTDPPRWSLFSRSGIAGSRPIIGKIHARRFRLQRRRSYQNSFAPHFYGTLTPRASGTTLEGRFAMLPAVKIFLSVWFTGALAFVGMTLAASVPAFVAGRPGVSGKAVFPMLASLSLPVFGYGLLRFGQWLGRNDTKDILKFLEQTLEIEGENK